ncbi:TfpX/TfpZ family type IV pilin accessory protein [Acinetobacter sp. BSP-53]|uniref:TfpX/TfpZ family type IV pilin accessory protein n=1 Tax=Acinetobacter sp. BSP-53 TaxID=3344662 RepID=UPI0037702510
MSKRLKFFLSHLLISFLIALLVVGMVFFVWYPMPLAKAVGVTHIFLMLLTIDVILGPVLGLLVYKEGKKSLKFDIAVIIALQVSALCYGVYSIEQGRPAWLVYYVDRFELIRKNDLLLENIDQAQSLFQQVSWGKPQFAAVKSAINAQQRQKDMFTEVLGGVSLAQQPERYVELTQVKNQIQQRAKNLAELKQYNDAQKVVNVLKKYPKANAFVPLKANTLDMTVLVNKDTAEIIKIVDLRPWK